MEKVCISIFFTFIYWFDYFAIGHTQHPSIRLYAQHHIKKFSITILISLSFSFVQYSFDFILILLLLLLFINHTSLSTQHNRLSCAPLSRCTFIVYSSKFLHRI